jgi:hypothetical protein
VPPPPFSLETEAPSLTLVDLAGLGAVPPGQTVWTKDTKITVTVTAKDNSGTGVQGVYARVESGVVQPATLSADGKWTASLDLLADGQNFVYVWGVDNVGNSGKGLAPPYQLAPKIGRDTTPPNLQLVDALSYTSEQGILLTSDAVPPQYKLAGARIAVRPDSPVYKAASRVSFGATAPTPADLEGANSNNVPYLKFSVGFRSGSDAPLVQPTYTIHIASGLTTQPPGGALIGDASPTTDTAYFYLPLAQETLFPGGAEAASSMTFTVTVTSADQVGNSTTTTFPTTGGVYTYNFVAPPLYITDSTAAYAAAAVPGSIYPLKITDVNYSKIFDGSDLRYTRLVLANPSAVPLQVAVSTVVGACGATETWNYATAQLPTTSSYAYGAHSYKGVYDWSICVYDSKTKYDCLGTATHPDGWYPCNSDFMDLGNSGIPLQYPYIGHDQWAGWALEFGCATLTDIYSYFRSGTDTNKAPVNLVLSNPLYAYSDSFLNQENQELPAVATVPAASNGQPGRISLYLKGSNKNLRTSELQWTTPSSFWPDVTFPKTVGMYPKFLMDYWDPITRGTAGDFYLKSQASRNYEYLNNSALSCSGTFSFTTDANSAFRALPAPQLSTVSTATKTYAY